jgi:hypothetical protein
MVLPYRREDWKSVSIPTGVQSVMIFGIILIIQGWFADN